MFIIFWLVMAIPGHAPFEHSEPAESLDACWTLARDALTRPHGALLPAGTKIQAGCIIEMTTPGSGGFGPPAARDRAAIGRDLLDGYVSAASAQRDYGIADPQALRNAAESED